jgi:hypothetical protein
MAYQLIFTNNVKNILTILYIIYILWLPLYTFQRCAREIYVSILRIDLYRRLADDDNLLLNHVRWSLFMINDFMFYLRLCI